MLKVIIADDEPRICKLLESLIDWEKEGFLLAGFASSGSEAVDLCISEHPDVLITDIRMPGLSGLELVQQLHKQMPSVYVIIITGYSQFQYAHQALRYGVVDYLLKPIRADELVAALNSVKEKIQNVSAPDVLKKDQKIHVKSMRIIKENLLHSLLTGSENNISAAWKKNLPEEFHIDFKGEFWRLVQVDIILDDTHDNLPAENYFLVKINEILTEEFKEDNLDLIFTHTENGYFCLLNGAEDGFLQFFSKLQTAKFILLQILGLFRGTLTISVSGLYRNANNIGTCVKECEEALDHKIIAGKNQIISFADIPVNSHTSEEFITADFDKRFRTAVADANIAVVSDCVTELMVTLNLLSREIRGTLVNEIYVKLVHLFFSAVSVFGTEEFGQDSEEQLLFQRKYFYSITAAFTYLNNLFQSMISALVEKKDGQTTRPIRNAQLYIDEHYNEAVSLQEVADYVGLAPSYLSSLFKKQMGKSLIEYLTYIRIQNAKQLLLDRNRNIADIAVEVGFVDEKYFIKRFRRVTGLTPKEYRKLFCSR